MSYIWILLVHAAPALAQGQTAKVYIILWFDTEDYMLPASDDATLRLARFLSGEKIRAVFKVVGERARTFERRGRKDVIEALKQHEIGFHAHWHSVHPTPAMYLSNLGWDEGVAEFERREKPGLAAVERIFGAKPTCYGQPGSSWAPQSFGAMRKWGMAAYLDAGSHIGLQGKPHYYCGMLNLYNLEHTLRADLTRPEILKQAEDRFLAARKKLLAEGGGLVSIYYHPCEFAHKQFWDAVNFKYGANPPREEWRAPPQKSPEETRVAWQIFEEYVRFIKRFPEVEFVTATMAARLYRDAAFNRIYTPTEIKAIAAGVQPNITFQQHETHALSAADVFALLNTYVADASAKRNSGGIKLESTPLGPTATIPALRESVTAEWSQFSRTAEDVQDFLVKQGRIPSTVWLGSVGVPPEAYLVAVAGVARELLAGKPPPSKIDLQPARLTAADFVAADAPRLWSWIIFPRGFRAPAMMELARQQAWTIKPALLH